MAATAQAEITADQLAALKIGMTTYDQVVAQFGRPTVVETSPDGERTITYSSINTLADGLRADIVTDRLEFDAHGILTKTSISDTEVNCSAYAHCDGH